MVWPLLVDFGLFLHSYLAPSMRRTYQPWLVLSLSLHSADSEVGRTMSSKDKSDIESSPTPEKRRHGEKEQIVELDGEYGYYKKDSFHSLSNFVLKCEGVVEENGEITGYMLRAKPKDNRDENVENWYLLIFIQFVVFNEF